MWAFLDDDATKTLIAAVSAGISLGGAGLTAGFAWLNFRRERLNQQLNFKLSRQKYFEEMRGWAVQICDLLTEAIHLCDLDPQRVEGESFFARRHRLLNAISSMIDRGRWFFPNIEVDDHGADNQLGYRGYRHEVLDGLVAAYTSVRRMDYRVQAKNHSIQTDLTIAKRHFVGHVQAILDPAGLIEEFNALMESHKRQRIRSPSSKSTILPTERLYEDNVRESLRKRVGLRRTGGGRNLSGPMV